MFEICLRPVKKRSQDEDDATMELEDPPIEPNVQEIAVPKNGSLKEKFKKDFVSKNFPRFS